MKGNVMPDRAWNTWDPHIPGAMVYLPGQLAVKLSAYSSKAGRYTEFPVGPEVRLGPHMADGSYVELELTHAGTRLGLQFAKADPFTWVGRARIISPGEWALRFWLMLEVGFRSDPAGAAAERESVTIRQPAGPAVYTDPPVVAAQWRSQQFRLVTAGRPVFAGLYDSQEVLRRELEEGGYYMPHPDQPTGRWAVLRFNGEESPEIRFALAQATDDAAATERALATLAQAEDIIAAAAAAAGRGPADQRAVRDVIAWNTIADPINGRWFTTPGRRWSTAKFGGWITWLTDLLYHALLAARVGDLETAEANLAAVMGSQQPAGNLPGLMSAFTEWVDRSQPPIGGYILWRIYLLTRSRALLQRCYPVLRRWHLWWFSHRDGNGNGLLEYGSSPTGSGSWVHTKLAAKDESSMDNLPVYDQARFDPAAHTLDLEDVALNSLLVLEGECLAEVARELGRPDEAAELAERAAALAEKVRTRLWDPEREIFAGRFWSGQFCPEIAPTSFFPLIAGIATPEQAERMIRRHLLNPAEFWGPLPMPTTPYNDPVAGENVYWRGRIWPPVNFLVYEGLRRYGYAAEATELARRSWAMFAAEWERDRHCHENYHISDPAGHDGPDSDPFYTWGALLPLMWMMERWDASPWTGISGDPARAEAGDELPLPGDTLAAQLDTAGALITRSGQPLLRLSRPVAFRDLVLDPGRIALRLVAAAGGNGEPSPDAPSAAAHVEVCLLGVPPERVAAVRVDGSPVKPAIRSNGVAVRLSPGQRVAFFLDPD